MRGTEQQSLESWIKKGRNSYNAACRLENYEDSLDTACRTFHTSVELILKGMLTYVGSEVPKNHNLLDIAESLNAENELFSEQELVQINQMRSYYLDPIYTGYETSFDDYNFCKKISERVLSVCEEKFGLLSKFGLLDGIRTETMKLFDKD